MHGPINITFTDDRIVAYFMEITWWLLRVTKLLCHFSYFPLWDSSCTSYVHRPSKVQWLLYVPPALTYNNSTFYLHSVFMCFVWISE